MTLRNVVSRRDLFLRYGPAALFALAAMRFDRALGQAAGSGKFIAFHTSSGFWHSALWPTTAAGALTSNSLQGKSLEPLREHLSDLLVVGGVSVGPTGTTWLKQGDGHNSGTIWLLTGNDVRNDGGSDTGTSLNYAASASLDQLLAAKKNRRGLRCMVAYPNYAVNRASGMLSYNTSGRALPAESSPLALFQSVFGSNGSRLYNECQMSPPPTMDPKAEQEAALRKSLLDANLAEFNDLLSSGRLSKSEREIVERMMSQFREVEGAVMSTAQPTGTSTNAGFQNALLKGCEKMRAEKFGLGGNDPSRAEVTKRSDLIFDIVSLAFALDLEDAAVLSWTPGGTGSTSYNPNHQHHGVSHWGELGKVHEPDGTDKARILASFDKYHAERFAALANRLKAFQANGGGSLLDKTILYWSSELSRGAAHNHEDVPMMFLGGKDLNMPRGQYLRYSNRPGNTRVLLSLGRRLGIADEQISQSKYRSEGPLF